MKCELGIVLVHLLWGLSSPYRVSSAHSSPRNVSAPKTTKPAAGETLVQLVLRLRSEHAVSRVRSPAEQMVLLLKIKGNSIQILHL